MNELTARQAALEILTKTETNHGYLNLVYMEVLKANSFSPLDAAFIKELVFGVYRNKLYLDYIIRANSSLRLKKIEPTVLNILRMGVYQILFMDKIPDHAAVSEAVSLAKKRSRGRTAGFVNAVLRSVLRSGGADLSPLKKDAVTYFSIKFSYPEELTSFFLSTFGKSRAETLLAAGNETPPLCVRVNILKTTRQELAEKLHRTGIETKETPFTDCGLYLFGASEQARREFSSLFTVQDQSSQLAALSLSPEPGDTVLDLCAAPGGKTTHLAELMENCGQIYASDLYEKRLHAVNEAAKRLGITIIKTKQADAAEPNPALRQIADKVLLDVPCSGLGIIRRKPDIKYKEHITDFDEILSVQQQILNTAKEYVKPGGILVYSTCTINPSENLGRVHAFLKENPNFEMDAMKNPHITGEMAQRAKAGFIELFPDTDNSDGFFVCRLKKLR